MQMTLGVAVPSIVNTKDVCVFCGGDHEEPKKEKVEPVAPSDKGWQRKSMKGIFEKTGERQKIYPGNSFPPSYSYQGHHCMALSAFAFDANSKSPRDRNMVLNHFLKKVGFFPNRDKNCIGLPSRKSYGAFEPFWKALDADKPVQLHGPGHDEAYFFRCDSLIAQLITVITDQDICEESSQDEMEQSLKELIEQAENYAFIKLCSLEDSGWDLHPEERKLAEQIYAAPTSQSFNVRGAKKVYRIESGKGHTNKSIHYPKPKLDTGPF